MHKQSKEEKKYLLTPFQKYFLYREQFKLFSSTVYVGAELNEDFEINIDLIKAAIKSMLQKDTNKELLLQINKENLMHNEEKDKEQKKSEIFLLKEQDLCFENFVKVYDDDQLTSILDPCLAEDILKDKIDIGVHNMPLWRVFYLPKMKCLIFNYSHIFYDGMSGTFFLDLLLEELEAIKGKTEVSDKLNVNDLSFLKANNVNIVDADLLDLNIIDVFPRTNLMSIDTLRFFLRCLLEMITALFQIIPNIVSKSALKVKFRSNLQSEANVFVQHSNVHVIKGSDMTKLLSVCKKNGFTFNSLLLSLLSLSGPENLINIKSENKDSVTCRHEISVPLNARRFLLHGEALQKKIGMFVTGGKIETCDIKLKSFENNAYGSVINLAKDLNDKVQNVCVQNFQKTVDEVGLLNLLADKTMKNLDSIFKENPKKICDYELSNLGSTNKKHTHLIKRLVFNQSFNPRSSNMTVSCITGGFSGDCVLSFMTTNEEELYTWGDRFGRVLAIFLSSNKNGSNTE
jgi:hypothetical protein